VHHSQQTSLHAISTDEEMVILIMILMRNRRPGRMAYVCQCILCITTPAYSHCSVFVHFSPTQGAV